MSAAPVKSPPSGLALVVAIGVAATIALRNEQLRVSQLEQQLAALRSELSGLSGRSMPVQLAGTAEEDGSSGLTPTAAEPTLASASTPSHAAAATTWLETAPVHPARILLLAVLLAVGWRGWQLVESCRAELADFSAGGGRDGVAAARLQDVITYRVEQWCATHTHTQTHTHTHTHRERERVISIVLCL